MSLINQMLKDIERREAESRASVMRKLYPEAQWGRFPPILPAGMALEVEPRFEPRLSRGQWPLLAGVATLALFIGASGIWVLNSRDVLFDSSRVAAAPAPAPPLNPHAPPLPAAVLPLPLAPVPSVLPGPAVVADRGAASVPSAPEVANAAVPAATPASAAGESPSATGQSIKARTSVGKLTLDPSATAEKSTPLPVVVAAPPVREVIPPAVLAPPPVREVPPRAIAKAPLPALPVTTPAAASAPVTPQAAVPPAKPATAPGREERLYEQALAEIRQGQGDQAQKTLREVIDIQPRHVQGRLALVRLLAEKKQAGPAADLLADGLMLMPQQAVFSQTLAALWFQTGQQDDAFALLAQADRYATNDAEFQAYYGSQLLRVKRFPDAAARFRLALRSRPGVADWLIALGLSLQGAGNNKEALDAFRGASEISSLPQQKRELVDQMIAGLRSKLGPPP